eukprot:TRINITY_DN210_c0_g1_i3.p1 TRINITY_DN210_c0_g1~~TRINITY_DN210_c0_g1_i3.p1  ORF type:complete len:372 (-),score=39.98 TRINITY_DN210_c0_g1_i3:6401-7516(-)
MGQVFANSRSRGYREESSSDTEDTASARNDSSAVDASVENKERMVIGLQATPYDAVILALTLHTDKLYTKTHGNAGLFLQVLFGITLLVMSFSIQIILVVSLLVTTIYVEKDPYRKGLDEKYNVLSAALASNPPLRLNVDDALEGDTLALCQTKSTLPLAHFLVLLLWNARMLAEIVDALWRLNVIRSLPVIDVRGRQTYPLIDDDNSNGKEEHIVGITRRIRVVCHCLVVLPQFLCAVLLWWMGTKFLFFAHSTDLLIMKAISLSFITQLDEIMFSAFGSLRFKARVNKASFRYYCDPPGWNWSMWGTSVVKFGVALGLLFFVHNVTFQKVTTFRYACDEYFKTYPLDYSPHYESIWTSFLEALELPQFS